MDKDRKKGLWSVVLVELTSYCNFSCAFCPSDNIKRKRVMMPRALWQKVIQEISDHKLAGRIYFHLLGEPLLHPDLFEAIAYANEKGLKVSVYTNGALLDAEKTIRLFDTLKNGNVIISMQNIDSEGFSKRSRGSLSWKEYLNRLEGVIRKAESLGRSVYLHCMVDVQAMGWNVWKVMKEQKKFQAFYERWCRMFGNIDPSTINIFNPIGVYPIGKETKFYVKHKGLWGGNVLDPDMEVRPNEKGHCDLITDTFAVLADGTCTYCCGDSDGKLDLGNAHEYSLQEVYYEEKATQIRQAEVEGRMLNVYCRQCRGTVVSKRTGKMISSRNFLTEYYYFKDHLRKFGIKSTLQRTVENLKRRLE